MVGSGLQTYVASTGHSATDIVKGSDLSVDNLELQGPTIPPSFTEAVLQQGGWDRAFYIIFWVNYEDLSNTMGAVILACGDVGQVTLERNMARVELHGLMKAYSTTFGENTSWLCRAALFGSRCKMVREDFLVTGTLTGVSADNMTLSDTARTEPGPAGSIAITISNTNPGHVTTATDLGLPDGAIVMISDVASMPAVNVMTAIRSPTATGFDLSVDTTNTTDYPPPGTGLVTPLGNESGWFNYGIFTPTSGPNFDIGWSEMVKEYVPGQWTLMLPPPFQLIVGDTYEMTAGCDKTFTTCKNKFDNVKNKRSEDYLPGADKQMQIPHPAA